MNSIWFDKVYYMFGFLFLCYGIMIITCASVTIMFVYYLLCAENYRWQWRAFASAGASAFFVFANALIYWVFRLRFSGLTSVVLFVGYSGLMSFLFFVLTGKSFISFTCLEWTSSGDADLLIMWVFSYRDHWLLLELGFYTSDLWLHSDRLID